MNRVLHFAYFEEAQPFINYYGAERLFEIKNIQLFFSESHRIYCLISGQGALNTAVATSIFFEKFISDPKKIICFNIGIAGGFNLPLHEIFYITKITNYHHLKSFYPEVYIKSNYAELMSIEFPADENIMMLYPHILFDMEGYAFATSLKYFVQNHQIHCIKFVSDNDGKIADINHLIDIYTKKLKSFIDITDAITNEYEKVCMNKNNHHEQVLHSYIENMDITFSQKQQLFKALKYALIHNKNISLFINDMFVKTLNATVSKHEKKQIINKLISDLYNV